MRQRFIQICRDLLSGYQDRVPVVEESLSRIKYLKSVFLGRCKNW